MELAFLQSEISVLSPSIRAKKKQEISLKISCRIVPPIGGCYSVLKVRVKGVELFTLTRSACHAKQNPFLTV